MLRDEFKKRYTTIPFAIHKMNCIEGAKDIIFTHYHQEIELIAITDGSAEFYINSKYHCAKKGDVLIIPPYALHRIRTSENAVTSYDCICFDLQLLCDERLKNGLESQTFSVNSLISSEHLYAEQLRMHIQNAVLACEKNEVGWELEAIGNMSLLFGLLKKHGDVLQNSEANKDTEFGKKVLTYLQKNVSAQITSRNAANELYMNHSYFCRLFKKTFGCPFAKYVLIYRLEKARIRLTNTEQSVTEIAFRLGFHNCSYFGKAFKERFHTSPLAYRKSRTE